MRLIVFAFLLSWTCYGQAQLNGKYNFIHLDQTDGLLHPNIFGISQDAQGYIWILTYNGLQRFDGTRFVNYPEVVQHTMPGTLGESNLYLDTLQNQISVGRSTTVEQFDLSTHQIKWIPSMDYIMANTSADRDTYFLDNGKRWLISDIGFTQYPPNANEADVVYLNPFPFQSNQAKYFMKDSITGRIWTGMYDHIVYGDPSTHHIKTAFTIAKNADGLASRFIFIDHERNLWISTWSPLFYRYNLVTGELSSYSLADIHLKTDQQRKENQNFIVQAFFEDRQHQLWIGTDNAGLLAYDRQHDVFNAITADDRLSNGIRYVYQIKCLYQDREDNIWVGTDQGISIFNPYHANIRVIRHEEGLESSLSSNDITDVIETAQGEILVATWGGG
ncbi:MAG TPA: two-component regulator propeller domain-containing protein, partial [Saprospiraceae bacterium]|nr:two-component regulator propeller domain-containing protein [Saprospiraceae bacterium]